MRPSPSTSAALALAVTMFVAALSQAAQPKSGYQIICHSSNPMTVVDRQFVEDVFLKRVTVWPTGEVTRPVDLVPSSAVRRQFAEDILRRPLEAVRSYWQQRIFSGADLPPPEFRTDDEIVR